jgi:hypothetical protein
MADRFASPMPRRSSGSRKSANARNCVLCGEVLEPRMLLSGSALSSLAAGLRPQAACLMPTNAPPSLVHPIWGNATVTGRNTSLSVLGSDDHGESKLIYKWSVTSAPAGGTATFNINGANAAKYATATFTKVGTYGISVTIVDAGGLSTSSAKTVVVSPTFTSVSIITGGNQIVSPNTTLTVSGTSQSLVAQGLDQFGNALAAPPVYTWSFATVPTNAPMPTLAATASRATVTFGRAGTYTVAVQAQTAGVSIVRNVPIWVTPVASALWRPQSDPTHVAGNSVLLTVPRFVDQFGNDLAASPAVTWSMKSSPANAPAPTLDATNNDLFVTFWFAGSYLISGRVSDAGGMSFTNNVIVDQTATSIALSPNVAYLLQGASQTFSPQALDQFGQTMQTQPDFTWSASGGTISGSGMFTAPSDIGRYTVTARSVSAIGTATAVVVANTGQLQDAALATLVASLDADGSINRQDMIQILRSVGDDDGEVDAAEFSDLTKILSQASTWNIPGYVQVLAGDVVNGNSANVTFQGLALGNLVAGSPAAKLDMLVDKWFLGADHPAVTDSSFVYQQTSGWLFRRTPSHYDERQGQIGDCYFISTLGTLADSDPATVRNMFINNGDGTFTVRFYTGTYGSIHGSDGTVSTGFTDNVGTADYVTVDRMLPATAAGTLVYANYGAGCTDAGNSLWIPLAEKAYAQWCETGKAGPDRTVQNAYASIDGGWMATANAQVLGHNAADYDMKTAREKALIDALFARKAVTIGTLNWSGPATVYGLHASHAYAVVGYNAPTDTFILYNPWGTDQPGRVAWGQLRQICDRLTVASASGSIAISGGLVTAGVRTAGVRDKAFEVLGRTWELHLHRPHIADPTQDVLSPALVDATFAGDGHPSRYTS